MFVAYSWIVKCVGLEACHRGAGVLAALLNAAVPLIGYLRCSDSVLFVISSITIALINAASYTVRDEANFESSPIRKRKSPVTPFSTIPKTV